MDGCGEDDLANPAVRASVLYAAGFLTGPDGIGNVAGHVEAGVVPDGLTVLLGNGLRRANGLRAEIHLVVRSHGAITPGRVDQQIGSFEPDCTVCADQQAAVFAPVR